MGFASWSFFILRPAAESRIKAAGSFALTKPSPSRKMK